MWNAVNGEWVQLHRKLVLYIQWAVVLCRFIVQPMSCILENEHRMKNYRKRQIQEWWRIHYIFCRKIFHHVIEHRHLHLGISSGEFRPISRISYKFVDHMNNSYGWRTKGCISSIIVKALFLLLWFFFHSHKSFLLVELLSAPPKVLLLSLLHATTGLVAVVWVPLKIFHINHRMKWKFHAVPWHKVSFVLFKLYRSKEQYTKWIRFAN